MSSPFKTDLFPFFLQRAPTTFTLSTNKASQPTTKEGIVDSFLCNCTDCHKITASIFTSNFIVREAETTHTRGKDKLTQYAQSKTVASGDTVTNHFCSVCGTLMYRVSSGFPGLLIPRIGTVDDFDLMVGKLKPRLEVFAKDRVKCLGGGEGVRQFEAGGALGQPFHDERREECWII